MAIELAKAKILVYDAETGREDFTALAPYLWGSTDSQVAAINAAEVLGKQLVGKKAEYAGDDVKGQTRKFGVDHEGRRRRRRRLQEGAGEVQGHRHQ